LQPDQLGGIGAAGAGVLGIGNREVSVRISAGGAISAV